jgi:hypothetical protein
MKPTHAVRASAALLALGALILVARSWVGPAGAQSEEPAPPFTPAGPVDSHPLFASFRSECPAGTVTIECAAMRGIIRARVIDALEGLDSGQDQRSLDVAIRVLSLGEEEAAVKQAAVILMRRFPADSRVPPALGRLLEDPHPALQEAAVSVLEDSGDGNWVRVAEQWTQGRSTLPRARSIMVSRQPPDVTRAGFTQYPGATHFSPGDSDRSVGLRTADPVDRVTKFYAAAAATKALDAAGWERERQRVGAPGSTGSGLSPEQAEIQRLADEFARTRNIKLARRMQKLAIQAARNARNPRPAPPPRPELRPAEAGIYAVQTPPGSRSDTTWRTVRVVPLETRGDRIVRAISIYREEAIRATVIQLLWDPTLFGAWDRLGAPAP